MKKVLVSALSLGMLAGCASYYDYYRGGVRYVQDGRDCIYYAGERGQHYSERVSGIEENMRVVYRNTRCEDLFRHDNFGQLPTPERLVLANGAAETPCMTAARTTKCSCAASQPVLKRRYIITQAM